MKKEYVYGGLSIFELTALVFVVLKLTGVINWGWLWVLAPVWIPVVLAILVVVLAIWYGKLMSGDD